MKGKKNRVYCAFALLLAMFVCGCTPQQTAGESAEFYLQESTAASDAAGNEQAVNSGVASQESRESGEEISQESRESGEEISQQSRESGEEISQESREPEGDNLREEVELTEVEIPAYAGDVYTQLNENQPFFTESELTTEAFENYSELDALGRCGMAYANVCQEIMPTEPRGEIGSVKPTGWHTVKYSDLIADNYLYNRCHLIAYQLAGENANEKNLITGTRYFNVTGMEPFESRVADYVKSTGNHVLYRVTPRYQGNNLVADGVIMEAESVEDAGAGLTFCIYVYNIQPGIVIDYADGSSSRDPDFNLEEAVRAGLLSPALLPDGSRLETPEPVTPEKSEEASLSPEEKTGDETAPAAQNSYILNTNTHKFHYPSCTSVNQMKDKNKAVSNDSRDTIIANGYVPCKRCNP